MPIGPQGLTNDNGSFVLARAEWVLLQKYVKDALALPINEEALREHLKMKKEDSADAFKEMLSAYKDMNSHCKNWENVIFPLTVDLAADLVHYADRAGVYYGALNSIVQQLVAEPTNMLVKQRFKGIVDSLAEQAKTYSDKAAKVKGLVEVFSTQSKADHVVMTKLVTEYRSKFGSTSKEVMELTTRLAQAKTLLDTLTKDYEHNVVVAATTPTYGWVPLVGWVAGIVVAAVYGTRATDALNNLNNVKTQIGETNEKIQFNIHLMSLVNQAEVSMGSILGDLNAALPVIGAIQGAWTSIAADLVNLNTLVDRDIRQALDIIKDLGIQSAINQWQKIGLQADGYRRNAFVAFSEAKAA